MYEKFERYFLQLSLFFVGASAAVTWALNQYITAEGAATGALPAWSLASFGVVVAAACLLLLGSRTATHIYKCLMAGAFLYSAWCVLVESLLN